MNSRVLQIDRFERTDDGWNLYPVGTEKPVFISDRLYSGKMPPFPRWHEQVVNLKVVCIGEFIVKAEIGNCLLFEIPQSGYSKEIKALCDKSEEWQKGGDKWIAEQNAKVNLALAKYLQEHQVTAHLETEISELPLCLRAYMKLHVQNGAFNDDQRRRLHLMLKVCRAADDIYRSYVDTGGLFVASSASLASLKFGYHPFGLFPSYLLNVYDIEKDLGDGLIALSDYYDAEKRINDNFAVPDDEMLKRYLNFVIREVLSEYANDYSEFVTDMKADFWGQRIFSDEKEYKLKYKKMKLLRYTNFILPRKFSDEEIYRFVCEKTMI